MRVSSRELFVGFLLVLGLVAIACQPVQPMTELTPETTNEVVLESEAVTDTATLSENVPVTESVPSREQSAPATVEITETATVSESAGSESAGSAGSEVTLDPALVAAGMATYRAQYCGVCHMSSAAETRGTFGPPHDGMAAIAAGHLADGTYHGAATTAAEYIRESIVDPQAYIVPGYASTSHRMPAYSHLDAATLDGLIAFLLAN